MRTQVQGNLVSRRHLLGGFIRPFCALSCARVSAQGISGSFREYNVKAAFLYNFAKFIEWPAAENRLPHIVLGVVGDNPFGPILEQALRGKTVRRKKIQIKRFAGIRDLELCDILFVNLADKNQLEAVLSVVKETPVLTVGTAWIFCGWAVL